jgi:ABC-type antimicrobial peptide transport system permease subunit
MSTLIVLVGLGAVLIYTLMLSDIEVIFLDFIYLFYLFSNKEKTYEYGMLRALGMSKKSFTALLVTTTQFFSMFNIILFIY